MLPTFQDKSHHLFARICARSISALIQLSFVHLYLLEYGFALGLLGIALGFTGFLFLFI
tara:strand:- start:19651 stop:19827 length:177 start_codon:yes stop_codon:yes gene_type:complete